MSESKKIYLDENLKVFYSEHPNWGVGKQMNEALLKLAAHKGYVVTIMKRGQQ